MATKEKGAAAKWKWLNKKEAHAQAKMQFGILVDFVFVLMQLGTRGTMSVHWLGLQS
jgi:hypothetical protein